MDSSPRQPLRRLILLRHQHAVPDQTVYAGGVDSCGGDRTGVSGLEGLYLPAACLAGILVSVAAAAVAVSERMTPW